MKIVLVIPTLKQGGAERVISELANMFSKKGHEVIVVLWIGGKRFYTLGPSVRVVDFQSNHHSKAAKVWSLIKATHKLNRIYRKEQPDAVISFLTKSNIISVLAAGFSDTKVYISERGSPAKWDSTHPRSTLLLRDYTYKRAEGFIAQTKRAKRVAEEKFGFERIMVVANPVRSFSHKSSSREKIILNVGRLHEGKGQDMLIEMFANLDAPDWKLVILGEGSYREILEEKVQHFNLEERVSIPGAQRDVDTWLLKASIFAFPSQYEGFPNALLEAMSAGLPCVSFDCETGPSDLIKDGKNGFLVPMDDTDLFEERLQKLVDDKLLRDKFSNEAVKIRTLYGLDNISDMLLDFIDNGVQNEEK